MSLHNLARSGVITTAVGIGLIMWQAPGLTDLMWVMGTYALIAGLLIGALGFRLRNGQSLESMALRARLGWPRPRPRPRRTLDK